MKTEYEATFYDVDIQEVKNKIKELGGKLVVPETLMKISVFHLPKEIGEKDGYVRVRDEGYKKTMALKIYTDDEGINQEKESEIEIIDYKAGVEFLKNLGLDKKGEREKKREIWELDGVEIMFDEWPFLEPYIEIEGKNEEEVKRISEKLCFKWDDAYFGVSYSKKVFDKYGISESDANDKITKITFDENPFEKFLLRSFWRKIKGSDNF